MLKKLKDRGWFYLFIVILVISTVIRVIYCLKVQGPRMYGDELLYRRGSAELFYEHKYYDTKYPMGYPLIISLSYLFKDFFRAIQGINIGLFLLGNIAVWKILRIFINEKGSFYGILLVSLFPSQYVYCSQLMSENLYYPLLMWTLYLFLWIFNQQKMKYKYCLGLGVMIASLHLTRHITIVLLPVLALCWFLDLKESGKWRLVLSKDRFVKGICVLLGYIAIYGSWVAYWLYNKQSISRIIGLSTSRGLGLETIQEYATAKSLFIFIVVYLSYVILAMPYEFPMEIKGFIKCIGGGVSFAVAKAGCLFWGTGLMLVIASIRHSWRCEYNYPDIQYILGRYILYIFPLFIIWYLITRRYIDIEKEKKSLLILHIINTILFIVAVLILCRGKIFGLSNRFLGNKNTADASYVQYIFKYIIGCFILIGIILFLRAKRYVWTINIFLPITLAYGLSILLKQESEIGIFGRTFGKLNESINMQNYEYIINDTPSGKLRYDIEFWTGVSEHPMRAYVEDDSIGDQEKEYQYIQYIYAYNTFNSEDTLYEQNSRNGLVFCATSEEYSSQPLITCVYGDVEYGIYECPIETSVQIIESQFNVQSNGQSVLEIQTNLSAGKYALYLNGEYYTEISIDRDGEGGAFIEDEIFQNPGELVVEIHFDKPYVIEDVETYLIEIIENIEDSYDTSNIGS